MARRMGLKIPRNAVKVALINRPFPAITCIERNVPSWLNLPAVPNDFISLEKPVMTYCTSGETDPNLTCVLAPCIAMGIMDDRMHTLVREMHAQ